MIPAPFEYQRAESTEHAVSLLEEFGEDAKLLAGGHSLLPMMKLRLAAPTVLVDLGRVSELSYIREDGDEIALGALTRHAEIESSELVRREAPLLRHAASLVGDPQVRNRGTIGGSLAHADPAADLPTAVTALDATLVVQGRSGARRLACSEFFAGWFETAVQPDEILVEVRVPRVPGVGWGYEKFTRRANDWAIVAAAACDGRVALANMGSRPLRATAVERALTEGADAADAAAHAADGTEPTGDMHADADYRRHLARVLTRRALSAARSSATG